MIISTARKRFFTGVDRMMHEKGQNRHQKTAHLKNAPNALHPGHHHIQNYKSQTARRRYLHVLANVVEIFVYLCGHVTEAVSVEDRAVLDIDAGGIENVAV